MSDHVYGTSMLINIEEKALILKLWWMCIGTGLLVKSYFVPFSVTSVGDNFWTVWVCCVFTWGCRKVGSNWKWGKRYLGSAFESSTSLFKKYQGKWRPCNTACSLHKVKVWYTINIFHLGQAGVHYICLEDLFLPDSKTENNIVREQCMVVLNRQWPHKLLWPSHRNSKDCICSWTYPLSNYHSLHWSISWSIK